MFRIYQLLRLVTRGKATHTKGADAKLRELSEYPTTKEIVNSALFRSRRESTRFPAVFPHPLIAIARLKLPPHPFSEKPKLPHCRAICRRELTFPADLL
jgi:hypothetical protein